MCWPLAPTLSRVCRSRSASGTGSSGLFPVLGLLRSPLVIISRQSAIRVTPGLFRKNLMMAIFKILQILLQRVTGWWKNNRFIRFLSFWPCWAVHFLPSIEASEVADSSFFGLEYHRQACRASRLKCCHKSARGYAATGRDGARRHQPSGPGTPGYSAAAEAQGPSDRNQHKPKHSCLSLLCLLSANVEHED